MEKLELKHLAPYLPYKLNVKTKIGNLILCQLNNSTKWNAWFYFCRNSKNKNQLYNFNNLKNADGIGRGFLLKEITPILRPISYLTKEIEVNGEKFVPIIKLAKIQYPKVDFEIKDFCCLGRLNSGVCLEFVIEDEIPFYKEYHNNIFLQRKSENYDDMFLANLKPSEIREKLFEWHFDVFGLIEKGLAIDINTLNDKQ